MCECAEKMEECRHVQECLDCRKLADKPICDLDQDKGVDRIKDAAQPPEFELGDLSVRSCIPMGYPLRSDLNAHSRQQNAKSTEKRARSRKPNSDLCGPPTLSTLARSARWNPRNGSKSTSRTASTCRCLQCFRKKAAAKLSLLRLCDLCAAASPWDTRSFSGTVSRRSSTCCT